MPSSLSEISSVFPDTVKLGGCLDILSVVCARTCADTANALRGFCLLHLLVNPKIEFSVPFFCFLPALFFHPVKLS